MGEFFGFNEHQLIEKGAIHTAREIQQQPLLWNEIAGDLEKQEHILKRFIKSALITTDRIILTGAGTSSYIGHSIKGVWKRNLSKPTEAISTTDFVSHPQDYIAAHENILLISFARSGNSPESVGAFEIANQICNRVYHIIITCNSSGHLAQIGKDYNAYVYHLPEKANDKSLAMTSSYSGMLLAGLLMAEIFANHSYAYQLNWVIKTAELFINEEYKKLKEIASLDFNRAVFLGSGALYGTAIESHLKMQELTDGRIICKHDSFLGFRHGPKAVVDEKTLMVYLFSNNKYVMQYENDLVNMMDKGKKPKFEIGISANKNTSVNLDYSFNRSNLLEDRDEIFLPVCMVLPSQLLGFFKSLHLGFMPDNPSTSGAISRVVEGVTIYPYHS
jgi:tagatose-6-phosphate ketose/aldose isomerase